jgi:uncharacterized Ntn-hydrolase superfamily protein
MRTIMALLLCNFVCSTSSAQVYKTNESLVHTFSIVARDSATGEMAVGVQSHWFSVGTSVSWGESGTGVVATQSFIDKSYGPNGLALMKSGLTAQQALDSLLKIDAGKEVRQVAFIDSKGNVAGHTGNKCIQYASDIQGANFSVQSNMMLGDKVCESMAAAFRSSYGKPLAERVLAALDAAQNAGGDIRGMQSAALIVVNGTATEKWNDKKIDVRVDDHDAPLKELRRLYNLYVAYQHMNNGDLATEKNDMETAMNEYRAAMKMFPENLEMQYWTAITLANNKRVTEALPMLKKIFIADKNWKELTKRLPAAGLLTVSAEEMKKIMEL